MLFSSVTLALTVPALAPGRAGATSTASTAPTPPDVFVAYTPITAQGATLGADSVESFNTATVDTITNGGSSTGTFTGNTISGSDVVTGVVSAFTLSAGMAVTSSALPSGTEIASVTGTTVTLTNPASQTELATITVTASEGSAQVGAQPIAEAVSPDGGTAYVLNSASDSITPVLTLGAPQSETPLALPSGYTPTAIAITPNGDDAWVTAQPTLVNSYAPALWEISLTGSSPGSLAQTILLPSTSAPTGLALTTNGDTALVSNFAGGTVIPVNLVSNSVGTPISVGPGPLGIAVSPNGNDAYVANSEGGSVTEIELASDTAEPATTLDAGYSPQQVAISPDGSTLWVTEDNGSTPGDSGFVVPVAIPSMTEGAPITVGYDPYGVSVSPDGSSVYVADETSLYSNAEGVSDSAGAISVVNVANHSAQNYLTNVDPIAVVVTPDEAPFASFTATAAPAGSATSFDASSSYSLTPGGLSFSWNFGDGSVSPPPTASNGYNELTSHVYALPGTYSVTLSVTDASGTSTEVVYTGQYVVDNGGPSASQTTSVDIPAAASQKPAMAYVADGQSDQVTPILADPAQADSPNVAGTPIDVGSHPIAVAISPNGRTAYVVNFGSDNVTEIDTTTNTASPQSAWISVGSEPDAIAITPDGTTAYVANSGDGTISKIALSTDTVQATIDVGGNPTGIAIAPDGETAYVTNNNPGFENLIPITLSNDTVQPGIPVGTLVSGTPTATDPVAVAITPDGTTAYVVDRGSNTVAGALTPVDLATATAGTPFSQIAGSGTALGTAPDAIAITPNAGAAYVTNFGSGTISQVTLTNDVATAISTGSAGTDPLGVAVTPDGTGVYVADGIPTTVGSTTPAGTVSVLTTPTTAEQPASIAVGEAPDAIAITPDQAPVATLTDLPGVAGSATTFSAAESVFPSSPAASYAWDFGDGTSATTSTPTTSHVYASGGDYSATVTVTDADESAAGASPLTQTFTGQTVLLNGGPGAEASQTVHVPYGLPTVTGVAPSSGDSGSATSVIVSGTNFYGVSAVDIGSTSLTSPSGFTVTSPTSISVTVPPTLGVGSFAVTVVNPAGTSAVTPAGVFTNLSTTTPPTGAPAITSMSINFGPLAGDTGVTIEGTNFSGTTAVDFGATPASSYTVNAAGTAITAISPASASPGTVDVTVTTSVATSAVTPADAFTYVPNPAPSEAPTVASLDPYFGPTSGLTDVTITGTNLTGATAVDFGSTPAESFSVTSATTITAVTPPVTAAGTVDVTVTTPEGVSSVVPGDAFTYESGTPSSGPVVTGVAPNVGPLAGGNNVVITGTNFDDVTVDFGTEPASSFSVNSGGTEIIAAAPSVAAAQTVDVVVTNSLGPSTITPADAYTYQPTAEFAPVVTSVSPASGAEAGGLSVTLTGSGFTRATDVYFGSTDVTNFFISGSGTSITVDSPAATSAGTVSVTVASPYGTSAISAADAFTYLPASPPTTGPQVTGVVPDVGTTAGATGVTITGTGFSGASSVDFGSTAATDYTVNAAGTAITAASPGVADPGSVDVTVTVGSDTSPVNSSDVFTYVTSALPQPLVSSLSPDSGPLAGGTSVTLTGTNLAGALAVTFGGVKGTSLVANATGTSITVVTPARKKAGIVPVVVETEGGLSPATASTMFTYESPPVIRTGDLYTALVPYRALDTRQKGEGGALGAGATRSLKVTGVGGVPSDAKAVLVNLTLTDPTKSTKVTLYPNGGTRPSVSSAIVGKGGTVAHLVEAAVGHDGSVSIHNSSGSVDVVVDVEGYFTPVSGTSHAGYYEGLSPTTVLNTATKGGGGPLGAKQSRTLKLSGVGGVPSTGVAAVVLDITASGASSPISAPDWVSVYPHGITRPLSSMLNPYAGTTASNVVVAKLGTSGSVVLFNYDGHTNLKVAVLGYFTSSSATAVPTTYTPATPKALLDTAAKGGGGPLGPASTRTLTVTGIAGIPAGAKWVWLDVTVSSTTAASYLTLYATGSSRPSLPSLSWTSGETLSEFVQVPVSHAGSITLYNSAGKANVIVSAVGSFSA